MGIHIRAAVKGSENLVGILNEAIAREIAGSTECIWRHLKVMGESGGAAAEVFRNVAIREMKHAGAVAERLSMIGGTLTAVPKPVPGGTTLDECLHLGVRSKEETIRFYKAAVEEAEEEGDAATAFILKEIAEEEEEHRDLFVLMLEAGESPCDSKLRLKSSDPGPETGTDRRFQKGILDSHV